MIKLNNAASDCMIHIPEAGWKTLPGGLPCLKAHSCQHCGMGLLASKGMSDDAPASVLAAKAHSFLSQLLHTCITDHPRHTVLIAIPGTWATAP